MKKLLIIFFALSLNIAFGQQLDNSNPRLWFWDHAESLSSINYNYGAPYQQYWTYTGGTQNTAPGSQDSRNNVSLSTTYKRAGNYSYRHYMEFRNDYPGLQWCRGEWGLLEPGQQTLANEWRWLGASILIDPNNAVENKRYQIGFDHKEVDDYRETPIWLGIVGTRYVLQGRYVPDGPDGNGIDLGPVQVGVWVDWLEERNWKTDNTGYIRFYKNGVLVFETYGKNHESDLSPIDRIQMGLYKWRWLNDTWQGEYPSGGDPTGTHIIYTDEIRVGKVTATLQDMLVGGTASNAPPTSIPGPNQTITLPQSTTILNGLGTDTDGSIVSYQWTKVSGPAGGNIVTPNSATTGLNSLNAGTYVYRLRVTDNGGAIGDNTMQVLVNSAQVVNAPPTVYAGDNKTITLPIDSVFMNSGAGGANASDPENGPLNYKWRKESGSGTISSPNILNTWIRGLTAGQSKFWLTVTDNAGDTATDYVLINVNPAPVLPTPTASALPASQTTILPKDSAYIDGSGSNIVGDSIQTYAWTKLSGPSGGTIRAASKPATSVYALTAGTYVFRLIVTAYNTKKDTADATVIVGAAPIATPPTVTIAGDSTLYIGYPITQVTVNAATTGTITSILWEQITGPSSSIVSQANDTTIIKDIDQTGIYVYKVTATDSEGTKTVDYVRVVFLGLTNRQFIKEGTNPARQ